MSETTSTASPPAVNGRSHPTAPVTHPALERFLQRVGGHHEVLLVRSLEGTGRVWFAEGWLADGRQAQDWSGRGPGSGGPLRWDSRTESAAAFIERIGRHRAERPGEPLAVVADAGAPVLEVTAYLDCALALPTDLMLTAEQIEEFRRGRAPGDDAPAAGDLYRMTGGWWKALAAAADGPRGGGPLHQPLLAPLARWLGARDPGWSMPAAAFLPVISERTLAAFQSDGESTPTIEQLAAAGLIRRDGPDSWFMPLLIRAALKELVRERDPHRVDRLRESAVHAMAAVGRLDDAIETAVRGRLWSVLHEVMVGRWVDLFTSDARRLRTLLGTLPALTRFARDEIHVLLRILSAAGPDRMVLPLPSVEPDLRRDRTAHRLARRTERLFRSPDAEAVSYGIMEISYLRLAGHYREAADAAVRLRRALDEAQDTHPISLPLASFTELHAGICLHLADRLPEAQVAYLNALDLARKAGHAFLEADVLSKYALWHVHVGEMESARVLLAERDGPLSQVGWGRFMVSRSGDLARAWIAVEELDLAAAEGILSRLPEEPDTDEFWSVHAFLLVLVEALQGRGEAAIRRLDGWRRERPYAAAPLADRLLDEAHHQAAMLAGDLSGVAGWEHNSALSTLEAVRNLRIGSREGALRALQVSSRSNARHQRVRGLLRLCAEHWPVGESDAGFVAAVRGMVRERPTTADLVPLAQLGLQDHLRSAGLVDEVSARRLSAVPRLAVTTVLRPELTPREAQLLDLLRQGMSRRMMAQTTYRSENTVKSQLRGLYAKLGAATAREALERARDFGY